MFVSCPSQFAVNCTSLNASYSRSWNHCSWMWVAMVPKCCPDPSKIVSKRHRWERKASWWIRKYTQRKIKGDKVGGAVPVNQSWFSSLTITSFWGERSQWQKQKATPRCGECWLRIQHRLRQSLMVLTLLHCPTRLISDRFCIDYWIVAAWPVSGKEFRHGHHDFLLSCCFQCLIPAKDGIPNALQWYCGNP